MTNLKIVKSRFWPGSVFNFFSQFWQYQKSKRGHKLDHQDKNQTNFGFWGHILVIRWTRIKLGYKLDICWTNSRHRQSLDKLLMTYIGNQHPEEFMVVAFYVVINSSSGENHGEPCWSRITKATGVSALRHGWGWSRGGLESQGRGGSDRWEAWPENQVTSKWSSEV